MILKPTTSNIINTRDGSKTLSWQGMNEHYHSTHGAIAEAKHVYLEAGLKYHKAKELAVFEMGFGTGLNAFMTFLENKNLNKKINYNALELNPLPYELVKELAYPKKLKADESFYEKMHQAPWNEKVPIDVCFSLLKIKDNLLSYDFEQSFDVIYYDAFGPRVQEELWTLDVFQKLYNATNNNGVLVTYCAKGQVKRNLKSVGFVLESLPGPPHKREMIRATRTNRL